MKARLKNFNNKNDFNKIEDILTKISYVFKCIHICNKTKLNIKFKICMISLQENVFNIFI